MIAFDAARRQPIAGVCARRYDNFEISVGMPNDLLACETVAIDRIRYEIAVVIIEGQRPKACGRGNARQDNVAAPVEKLSVIVGVDVE